MFTEVQSVHFRPLTQFFILQDFKASKTYFFRTGSNILLVLAISVPLSYFSFPLFFRLPFSFIHRHSFITPFFAFFLTFEFFSLFISSNATLSFILHFPFLNFGNSFFLKSHFSPGPSFHLHFPLLISFSKFY